MGASRLLVLVLSLHAGAGAAQEEPPATSDPRPPAEKLLLAPPGATEALPSPWQPPSSTQEPPPAAPARGTGEGVASVPVAAPHAGEFRWEVMASYGAGSAGAPNGLFGIGLTLGSVQGVRIEANALLGWSSATQGVPVSASWNDGFLTYTSATTSARTFLFELSGSRRVGSFELWAGGGVHVSFVQFDAEYNETRCADLLCFNTYPATDTDSKLGSAATGLLLSAGARVPLFDHLLLGLDLRYLSSATSTVGDRYSVSSRLGGVAATLGLILRFGAFVPR